MCSCLWIAPVNVRPKRAQASQCCETQIAQHPDASSLPAWLITIITATASFFQRWATPEARHLRARSATSGQACNSAELNLNRQAHARYYVTPTQKTKGKIVFQARNLAVSKTKTFATRDAPRRLLDIPKRFQGAFETPQDPQIRLQDGPTRS